MLNLPNGLWPDDSTTLQMMLNNYLKTSFVITNKATTIPSLKEITHHR